MTRAIQHPIWHLRLSIVRRSLAIDYVYPIWHSICMIIALYHPIWHHLSLSCVYYLPFWWGIIHSWHPFILIGHPLGISLTWQTSSSHLLGMIIRWHPNIILASTIIHLASFFHSGIMSLLRSSWTHLRVSPSICMAPHLHGGTSWLISPSDSIWHIHSICANIN